MNPADMFLSPVGRLRATARPGSGPGLRGIPALCLLLALLFLAVTPARAALPIEQWTTPAGARVLFVRAPGIPMLDLRLDLDAGSRFDPAGRSGLAALTRSMLMRGSQGLPEAAIDQGFADIGALTGGGADDDRTSISLRSLSSPEVLNQAVDLLARVLARPDFDAAIFERERARVVQAVREADARPAGIAQREFGRLLYGSHPYGQEPDVASLGALDPAQLQGFFNAHYGASRAVVTLIGDVDRARAEAIAERLTAVLPAGAGRPDEVPAVELPRMAERRIPHAASQSHILIGVPAVARGDADYFALLVGNYVLGGGSFVSRLYEEVREKRGLAYSVYSYFAPRLQPGPFTIGLQTQKAQTVQALDIVRETLHRFVKEGPTAAELKAAKDNLVGGFPLRIDSNAKLLENLSMIGFYRLPLDYLDTWTDQISAVTATQVREAFARRVPLERLVTVVVGAGETTAGR